MKEEEEEALFVVFEQTEEKEEKEEEKGVRDKSKEKVWKAISAVLYQ